MKDYMNNRRMEYSDKPLLLQRVRDAWRAFVKSFEETGGVFMHSEPDGPLDEGGYDDPTLPKPRRPIVDDDLEDWPIRWW